MTVPLLEIRSLTKDFPAGGLMGNSSRVVADVSMAVETGEACGIVGESGSGKTTLARCCLRLITPSSGSVCFDGRDLARLSSAELRNARREFQMVFQDPYASLNPGMTVEQILLEPFEVHRIGTAKERRLRLGDLMQAVSLDASLLRRKPAELSGGQQQRVGIARGLALKPRLLVADEPVSALDVSVQAQILNLLADVKKRYDFTLVLISHSLYAIRYLCTRMSVMYKGRMVEESSTDAFFAGAKHPYSRLLLGSMPGSGGSDEAGTAKKENSAPAADSRTGCVFQPRCPQRLPICSKRIPPFQNTAPGEKVACFLYC